MPTTLNNEAAIVGIGQTKFSKNSGVSELALAVEAVSKAIEDAGIEPSQVDGFSAFTLDTNDEVDISRAVGTGDAAFFSRVPYGGGVIDRSLPARMRACVARSSARSRQSRHACRFAEPRHG